MKANVVNIAYQLVAPSSCNCKAELGNVSCYWNHLESFVAQKLSPTTREYLPQKFSSFPVNLHFKHQFIADT